MADSTVTCMRFWLNVLNRRISGRLIGYQRYATTEMFFEEIQRLPEGAEDAVMQI